ncbi:hypothetical protein GGI24_006682, partial [Coemansia furcata]
YINRNYTLEVVEEEAIDALVKIRGEPIVMSAPVVSGASGTDGEVAAECPSGPNTSCCKVDRSSNGTVSSRQNSRSTVQPRSVPLFRDPNAPRFKVERRLNGADAPRPDSSEQLLSGSAPQFRVPTGRRAERSNSVTFRALDHHSNSEGQQHRHSRERSAGSAVAPTLGHDSGIQLSPNGMHYSDSTPGGDGRPNCKCGCDCGTFLDTLIRAIEDRVRGAVPLAEAEANGDTAAMNRFIREILSPLDNPLLVSGARGQLRRGSESAMSQSQGSESYEASDSL